MRFRGFIWVALRAAVSVLSRNRWRSLLTLAICASGTAGVIAAGVLAEINLNDMRTRLGTLGGNLLVVSPNKLPPFPGRPRQLEHFISLLPEDGAALQKLAGAETVVPVIARETTIRMNSRGIRVRLIGTTSNYLGVRSFTLDHGRFFSSEDEGRRVIVLGSAVSRELDPQGVRAGHIVLLGGNPYTIIGVLRPQGVNFAGEDEDHQAFIPLATYQQRVANRFWLTSIYIQLPQGSDSQSVVQGIQTLLRQRHGRWDYQVDDTVIRNIADLASQQSQLLTTVVWAVTVTSVLLLLTGAAGVTTLMLIVVRQRRAEIGLRRALGATPVDIAFQFFIEGIVLAGAGILIGLAFGFGGSYFAIQAFALQPVWTSNLPLLGVFLSLTASVAACVVPAVMAGRLEPSVALQP